LRIADGKGENFLGCYVGNDDQLEFEDVQNVVVVVIFGHCILQASGTCYISIWV
jgi:hypothetical protein